MTGYNTRDTGARPLRTEGDEGVCAIKIILRKTGWNTKPAGS
jgi:hypothetical protein